ncbi:polyketide cyclase [Pseudonocardia sp. EC080610-09]|uniref:SRPBCC family protein n=1 Tax=unclassified Pseudonocardia TaxID=2619320 RepID=UPI0006CB4650|nr:MULTISPECIES: SRPBCC family protein [unclassified Pseudonocardia]ALE75711.1 polyketide cyclase [Pseudonocardia sp. EC080625-04]ALL75093.1 polyketide cyclase [Pseudonocardia sp. EC080610-09]ALL82115.1 polyketide cyclase [Pseudonocardia sp. EC080619-01]
MSSRHVGVVIAAPPETVYAWVRDPRNLPRWAAGVGDRVEERDGRWIVPGGPLGEVEFRFVPENDWGVLDHEVVLPSGEVAHNPLRVAPHPDGSEIVFSVRRAPSATDADVERDVAAVVADLERLRDLLEATPRPGPTT